MELEAAIRSAIEYEKRVCDIYKEAEQELPEGTRNRLVNALYKDELFHVRYLEAKLDQCQREGQVIVNKIKQNVLPKWDVKEEASKIREHMSEKDLGDKKRILSKILKAELETSAFYRNLFNEIPDEGKELIAHFLEIEDTHVTLVQAELDLYSHTGFWFDNKEFDME